MSPVRKPVVVRKLTRDWCAGYATADLNTVLTLPATVSGTSLELLDSSGRLLEIAWNEVKWVCYVRELTAARGSDLLNPERLLRRRFSSRPRIAGVWMRLTMTDGDELEGVAANDRSLIAGGGLLLIPPDTRSNTQRVFVPRTAIRDLAVLGLVTPGSIQSRGAKARGEMAGQQPELFVQVDEE